MDAPRYTAVLPLAEFAEGATYVADIDGVAIVIARDEGEVFALENRCSHMDAALADGRVRWGCITCPAHGAKFALDTGEALTRPATQAIRTFPVRIADGMIEVAA